MLAALKPSSKYPFYVTVQPPPFFLLSIQVEKCEFMLNKKGLSADKNTTHCISSMRRNVRTRKERYLYLRFIFEAGHAEVYL